MILSMADLTIRVTHCYKYLIAFSRGYLAPDTGETPDIDVTVTQEDIAAERARAVSGESSGFSDAYFESVAAFRLIAERVPAFGRYLMHGSAVAVDGAGYLFTAPSGTGKSTHAGLWRQLLGERAVMVNDDKPFIRVTDNDVWVCGTPWNGKHRLGSNISVPLKGICILHRGETNRIEPATHAEALTALMTQSYRPADLEALSRTLGLIETVLATVPVYSLYCNMEPDAARVSYEYMCPGHDAAAHADAVAAANTNTNADMNSGVPAH